MNARHAKISVAPGHDAQQGHWPTVTGLFPSRPVTDLSVALVPDDSQDTVMAMRILVIEDDREAATYLLRALKEAGHVAELAADGEEGMHMASSGRYDVMIVDRMLPRLDGLSLLKQLRADGNTTPALILSALGQVDDRVEGLRSGGDDYLSKPYAFSELLARIEVVAKRRRADEVGTTLRIADLELDRLAHTVKRAGKNIPLQPREYRLLEYLMRNAGKVVTRTMLLEEVWDYHFDPQTNVIDVHVSRLRSKIDKDFDSHLLHTIRGSGYVLREPQAG
jgi:two-component system, OmpR family, response regulator